jgi:hypothetical protein
MPSLIFKRVKAGRERMEVVTLRKVVREIE